MADRSKCPGCFPSHYRVCEEALNDGPESILVFEEDAVFRPGFSLRAKKFFAAIPDDWNWIYLGGQQIEQEWGLPTRKMRQRFFSPSSDSREAIAVAHLRHVQYPVANP
jgi:hypothetical protein